jgi:hypothetical protein
MASPQLTWRIRLGSAGPAPAVSAAEDIQRQIQRGRIGGANFHLCWFGDNEIDRIEDICYNYFSFFSDFVTDKRLVSLFKLVRCLCKSSEF